MFAAVSVSGLAFLLAIVSGISWWRLRNRRALFIGVGFVAFGAKGVYLVARAYELRGSEPFLLVTALFDLAILVFLYLALRIR